MSEEKEEFVQRQQKNKRKKMLFTVFFIALFVFAFICIKSAVDLKLWKADIRMKSLEREKQTLIEQNEYLEQILSKQTLEYTVIFNGTEDKLRNSLLSDGAAGLDGQISPREAAEIIDILENHVNEPVDFTLRCDDYLLAVYKDLIGAEVRYHVKYVLVNASSMDIYFKCEVLPFTPDASSQNRLIYHWVKILKIPCEAPCERSVVFHIL